MLHESLTFLKELKVNNNKTWMQDHKHAYQQAKDEFLTFTGDVILKMGAIDESLIGLDPKKSVFRLNRDLRFSKDKSPYKTNFGMYLSEGGKKSIEASYYFHLEPGNNSFLAGGLYAPDANTLAKVRQEIDYNSADLKSITDKRSFRELFGAVQGETLKRAPKGFSEDHPNIGLLKLKSYIVLHRVTDDELLNWATADPCVAVFREIKPFNDYLNVAIS